MKTPQNNPGKSPLQILLEQSQLKQQALLEEMLQMSKAAQAGEGLDVWKYEELEARVNTWKEVIADIGALMISTA